MAMIANHDKIDTRDLNRSWIVRVGKKFRKLINPAVKRSSLVGDHPVFNTQDFPWLKDLEANWTAIRDEAQYVLRFQDAVPPISVLSPDHKNLDAQKKWLSYFLWGYGYKSAENCARCPETTRLVESVPGMMTALFSIHKPGMIIKPHKGVTAGICVCHLGLIIPKDTDNCAIRVDDQIVHWQNGEAFVFDDTYKHETWNNTDEIRVILLLHFKRPLRFPGSWLAATFMWAIQRTPFIQDAVNNMKLWESQFRELEANQPGIENDMRS